MRGRKLIMDKQIFRKKSIDRISSPEQLNTYLKVTSPAIWMVLTAVIALLAGLFIWASLESLETTVPAKAVVKDRTALITVTGTDSDMICEGMTVRIGEEESVILSVAKNENRETETIAHMDIPDGTWEARIVTESFSPISFLLNK